MRRVPAERRAHRRDLAAGALLLCAVGLAVPTHAQERAQTLSARIDAQTGHVVNSALGGRENGDTFVEVRPGVSWRSRAGRVVGSVDYSLGLTQRSRHEVTDPVTNALAANVSAEAVPGRLFVDFTANVDQGTRDPLGQISLNGSPLDNRNRVEVGRYSLTPSLRGELGGSGITYQFRGEATAVHARGSSADDSSTAGGDIQIGSVGPGTLVGWSLQATTRKSNYEQGVDARNTRAFASVFWIPDPDLTLSVRGGEESNDGLTGTSQRTSTWGGGLTWRPSPRTRVQLDGEERYFGRSHNALVEHRLARWVLRAGSQRAVNEGFAQLLVPTTALQVAAAQSSITDPDQRNSAVRAELLAAGINPDSPVVLGFVTRSSTVQDRHEVGLSYGGVRLSMAAQAYRGRSRPTFGAGESVRQSGYTGSADYRLTPTSSVGLRGSRQMAASLMGSSRSDLKSLDATWTQLVGRRTSAAVTARYTVFNSTLNPYRESAVTASLSHRF